MKSDKENNNSLQNANQTLEQAIANVEESLKCETDAGSIHVEWDNDAPITPFGQFVFFAHFLKSCDLFQNWVIDCPIWNHPNWRPASRHQALRNLLGSYLLSTLSGHNRYAHVTAIRHDKVNPGLLGMTKIYSEDTVRRAFQDSNQKSVENWMQKHLEHCYKPLLKEPYILDVDSSIKTLYGHQQGAKVGYNPHKPGRPSHVIHTYMMSTTRLILDCEVQPGIQTPANYSMPRLLELLNSWTPEERPDLIRGDCAFGNEKVLFPLEELRVDYLFKLKQTKKVKGLIDLVTKKDSNWSDAGQGWEGVTSLLKLSGWSRTRRVIILRRMHVKKQPTRRKKKKDNPNQLVLPCFNGYNWTELLMANYEYAVLVTTLDEEKLKAIALRQNESDSSTVTSENADVSAFIDEKSKSQSNASILPVKQLPAPPICRSFVFTIAQLYRDRATCENNFDELKNQWGWGGFVTKDLFRSQVSARIVALVYNWWSLFTRWVDPTKHREGITSRPLMLHGVGRKITHAGKTTLKITSLHAKRSQIQESISLIQSFLQKVRIYAQKILSSLQRWHLILSLIFKEFLQGRLLGVPSG